MTESPFFGKGISMKEQNIHEWLRTVYPTIRYQYTSEDYPHLCDYYIPEKDLYIEYQGSQYHHGHPFDSNNEEDIKELENLNQRSEEKREKTDKKNQYDFIIEQWTKRDPARRQEVTEKGLNWLEIWPDDTSVGIIEKIESYPNIQDSSEDVSIYRPLSFKPTVEDLF